MVSSHMTTEKLQPPPAIEARDPDIKPRNMGICVWCGNRSREVCPPCQQEGKYLYLEPAPLDPWEQPPELPAMRELVDLPAPERLAIIWLGVRYGQTKHPPGDL